MTVAESDPLIRERGLWTAALGGGAAWFADLVARYFLVEAGLARTRPLAIAAVGAVALAAAGLAAIACFRRARRHRAGHEATPSAFVARWGAGLNLLFALLIAVTLLQQVLPAGSP